MEKRYFTVAEANQMIPELQISFGRILQMHGQIRTLYQTLEAVGFAPRSSQFSLDPEGADQSVIHDRASLKTLLSALQEDLTQLHKAGCQIKDVEQGLVDWYAQKEGRDVFLCWKLGEKQLAYWHEIDAGYGGRRPISEFDTAECLM